MSRFFHKPSLLGAHKQNATMNGKKKGKDGKKML